MDYTRDYFVHYYEIDRTSRLSLPALIQYFEDIAILHSSSLGYDLSYYETQNSGWMLIKWEVSITKLPFFAESIQIVTRVHAMKRFLADREFFLYSSDGILLATARSNWLLMDTVRRRPLKVAEEQFVKYGVPAGSEANFIMIPDVPFLPPGSTDGQRKITTANSDIDTNLHVNNVRYLEWALDSLPKSVSEDFEPSGFRVQYKKELSLGDEAVVYYSLREKTDLAEKIIETAHTLVKGVDEICSMEITWRKK